MMSNPGRPRILRELRKLIGRMWEAILAQGPPWDEPDRIRAALDAHRWNRVAAAEALGMSRTTLWRKMREHGLLS